MWHSLSSAPELSTVCFTQVYILVEGSQTWECDAMINMDALAFLYTQIIWDVPHPVTVTTRILKLFRVYSKVSKRVTNWMCLENSWPPIGGLDQSYNHNHSLIKWAINRWVIAYYEKGIVLPGIISLYIYRLISIMNCRKGFKHCFAQGSPVHVVECMECMDLVTWSFFRFSKIHISCSRCATEARWSLPGP